MKTYDEPTSKKTIIFLTLMVGLSALLLISYNNFIATQNPTSELGIKLNLKKVLPGATELKPVEDESGKILYYQGFDNSGQIIGYGSIFTFIGLWSEITLGIGLDLDYKLTGLIVLKQGETPGLGARIEEKWFQKQFEGLTAEEVELKKYSGKIDAITGATVTSKAVTKAVRREIMDLKSRTGD